MARSQNSATGTVEADGVGEAPAANRRRFPADERRARMLEKAAAHFAEHGFDSSTREIAAAMGVTQALIYRHFESKEDLVERTLEHTFGAASAGPWLDAGRPLAQELKRFYRALAARAGETRMRLFVRAGLDRKRWATRRGDALTRNLFIPFIAALRAKAGLPDLLRQPAMRGERELAMMLHASVVFLGIRRHVYGMPMPDKFDEVVDLYVDSFMAGAPDQMRRLHDTGEASLTVELLAPTVSRKSAQSVSEPGRKQTSSR